MAGAKAGAELPHSNKLFADDEEGARVEAVRVAGVPEDAPGGKRDFTRDAASEEDLQAVAGPLGAALVVVGGAKDRAALGENFVKKKSGVQADGIHWRTRGCLLVVGGDEQQVGVDGVRTKRVAAHHLECIPVNFLQRDALRRLVLAEPVSVLQVAGKDRSRRSPAMQRVNRLRGKLRGGFGRAD